MVKILIWEFVYIDGFENGDDKFFFNGKDDGVRDVVRYSMFDKG